MHDSTTLHEGVNTLPLSTYEGDGLNSVYMINADDIQYSSEVAPGNVQFGNYQNEYDARWIDSESFYMEDNQVYIGDDTFINAVIFGKTYQVRFE